MAEFSKLVTTKKGHALIAKMLAASGEVDINFTRIIASDKQFDTTQIDQLENEESLSPEKQSGSITKLERVNDVAVKIETSFSNTELTEGYYMRSLGLMAQDPDDGEILFAITIEVTGQCWMPAYNAVSVSGVYIQMVATVGNADNVTVEINPGASATVGDVQALQAQIDVIKEQIVVLIGPETTELGNNTLLFVTEAEG